MKTTKPLFIIIMACALLNALAILSPNECHAQCPSCTGNPPVNDACLGAINLGQLNSPLICPLGTGTPQTFSGSNVCATAEFPYGYIIGCQTGGDMAAPSADVWYRFSITGTVLNVQLTSALRGVSIGLWQDPGTGCDDLVARNCAQTTTSGNLTATFSSLNPGVYYLQISGADTLDQCTFSLTLTNNEDCAACIRQNNLTVSPPPVNGRYQAGTTVTFTYTVLHYNQTATNWIHGIVPHFGNGWDMSTLTNQIPPISCDVNGTWGWYNRVITGTFRPISDGPGFFFESTLGCPATGCDPNNPGDNYGDQGVNGDPLAGPICQLTFQWTITTVASCPPGVTGDDLSVEIFNYGDSETGSWTSPACENDPNYRFFATLFCCDSSIITVQSNVSCFGGNDGSVNVQGRGIAPFDYELLDLAGNVLQSQLGDSSDHTFTGLPAGFYRVRTRDENNCTDIRQIVISQPLEVAVYGDVNNVSCNGYSDGSVDANVFGGTPPYSYQWDDPANQTTEIATDLVSGTYSVTATDTKGCQASQSFTVSEPLPFAGVISAVQVPCAGATGTAVLLMSGGTVPYSYSWSTGDTTNRIVVTAGTYFFTATDAHQCTFTDSTVLSDAPAIPNTLISAQICDGDSFFAGGAFQTQPGIYFDTLFTSAGCDSVIETNLQVSPAIILQVDASICQGDSFFAGGAYQTQSGVYTDSFTTASGCDSIVITALTVGSVVTENRSVSICQGDSFFVGGAFQTQAGLYYDTFSTSAGCDSVLITDLAVLSITTETIQVSICDGESYFAGGAFQTQSGTYYDTLTASNGCDSILVTELTVLPVTTGNVQVSICEGESYFAGGGFQTESGTYYDTLTASNGCDSILVTELTVLPVTTGNVQVSICEGESYFAGGGFQTESGTYYDTLTASNGCDSILVTELTVLPVTTGNVQVSICEGESYFAGGAFQTQSGTYYDTLTGSNGCDSILITELTVLPLTAGNEQVSICVGDSVFVGGAYQKEKGFYVDTLTGSSGCDSILTTEVIVIPLSLGNTQVSICDGDSFFVGGAFQTQPGFYVDTLSGLASSGCDSILTTELIVIPPSNGSTQVSICEGESYFAGGGNQTEPGFYVDTLSNAAANGCDSILTTELIVIPVTFGNVTASICDGESIFAGGGFQTQPGFYVDTLTGSNGCDSILTTEVMVLPNVSSVRNLDVCSGDGVFAGGAFQTASGTYYDTLVAANGCDSILITNLNVGEPIEINFDVNEPGCCPGSGNGGVGGVPQACPFDISALQHGTHVDSLFIPLGMTVVAIPNTGGRQDAVIYNTNGNWTEDPDLNVGIGNVIIINENPNNGDGDGTGPDDNATGGTLRFLFASSVTVVSVVAVDADEPGTFVNAYDSAGNLLTSVAIPVSTNQSVQTVTVNAPGIRRLDITYRDSGGFRLNLECPSAQGCGLDMSGLVHGEIIANQFSSQGITVTGVSNNPSQFPNAVAIFNSNLSNTTHDDLEVGIGNLLILPYNLTDNNSDGIIDNLRDSPAGGKIIFTFDSERTVISLTLADNDFNGTVIRVFDGNNNLLLSVTAPPPNLPSGTKHFEVIPLNVPGARRVEVSYIYKLGVTALLLDCPVVNCCDGNATANASGGFPPYQFAWSTGSSASYSGDSLCPGAYSVTVTDALGCSATESLSLVSANVTTATAQICEGDSILLEGAYQTKAGFYYDTLGFNNGCFEILKTQLIVLPVSQSMVQAQICQGQSYFAGGAFQTESGTYIDILTAANGCDSILTTELAVLPALTSQTDVEICEGQSYFAGGAFQTASGAYYDTLTSSGGCDSLVVTNLTVLPSPMTTINAVICEGESYFAGGAFQTEPGIYFDTLTTAAGCDSIVITMLTVIAPVVMNIPAKICEGESYFAGGAFQTQSGTYYDTLTSASGCDSIVVTELSVYPSPVVNTAAQICEGESYFAGGAFQSESGTYYDTFTTAFGCDSVVITDLTVIAPVFENLSAEICEGESYFAGGAFQTQSGTYYDTLTSASGCDSIAVTELTVHPSPVVNASVQICEGDSFFTGGAFQTQPGTYYDTFSTAFGCDSVVITDLTVITPVSENVSAIICDGESYFAGGAFQTQSGTYYDTLSSPLGCDSIVITDLTVLPAPVTSLSTQICAGDSFFAGGMYQTQSGIYYDTLSTAAGCDSIIETTLSVLSVLTVNISAEICEGESYFAGGAFQTQSGTYVDSFLSSAGCDSVVITDLTVHPAYDLTQDVRICVGDSFFAGGAFQSQAGTYVDSFTTASGCDSIITTNLDVQQPTTINQQVTICEGDSFFAGGAFQTQEGTYTDSLTSSAGCDSIVITELLVSRVTITLQSQINASCFGAMDGGLFITVSGGVAPYDVFWIDGHYQQVNEGGTATLTGVTAGSYSVTVIDAVGCSAAGSFTVNEPDRLALGAVSTPPTCNGGSDGSIDLMVLGGTPPYSYLWSTGDTTEDISGRPAGFDTVQISDANGCMATLIVEVVEPAPLPLTTVRDTICEGDSLFAGGTYQTESGTYYDTLSNADGCDSIIATELTVLPAPVNNVSVSICDGQSYFAGGTFQTTSGIYYDTFAAASGCDSIIITELTVTPEITITIQAQICEGDSLFAGGAYQTTSGVYYDTLTATAGCDSIVITELTVNEVLLTGIEWLLCTGDSVLIGGTYQTQSGTYYDTLQSSAGCDSIIVWDVFEVPSSADTVLAEICDNEFYFAGGGFQNQSGIYYDTLLNEFGCQIIVTTVLTVNPTKVTGIEAVICEGDSVFAGGAWQTLAGTYYDTLQTSAGCDSLLAWDVIVLPVSIEFVQAAICEGESYFAGGAFQTQSGTYFDTLLNRFGCDSIVTTDLTVLINSSAFVSVQICRGDSFFVGGAYQTQPGEYVDTLISANGCDSIVTTNLSFFSPIALGTLITNVSCHGGSDGAIDLFVQGNAPPFIFSWSTGDTTEDISGLSAGIYTVVVTDNNGCNATIFVQVTEPDSLVLSAIDTDESVAGAGDGAIDLTVTGGTTPYSYLWSTGDTTQDLSGLSAGAYTVTMVDANGCTAAAGFNVSIQNPFIIISGAASAPIQFDVTIYPNPFSDRLWVQIDSKEAGSGWLVMSDLLGRKVMLRQIEILTGQNKFEIPVDSRLASATYLLEVIASDGNKKVVKPVVKE